MSSIVPKSFESAFDGKRNDLRKKLKVKDGLLELLQDAKLISADQRKAIAAENATEERMASKLMDELLRADDSKVDVFLKCLKEDSQEHVVNIILGERVAEWERQFKWTDSAAGIEVGQVMPELVAPAASNRTYVVHQEVQPRPAENTEMDDERETDRYMKEVQGEAIMEISFKTLTEDDYKRQAKGAYPMTHEPRGRVLIINNEYFTQSATREGTAYDEHNLKKLFGKLKFKVEVEKGTNVEEIRELLKNESERDHSAFDVFILVILSHGSRGNILGVDENELAIDDIVSYFDASKCETLKGKPKIFIIQACQGGANSYAFQDDSGSQPGVHDKADVLIACSAVEGYKAWRAPGLGSCFIRSLVYVLKYYAHEKHFLDMLTKVNGLMECWKIKDREQREINLLGDFRCRLTKDLYLFPGK